MATITEKELPVPEEEWEKVQKYYSENEAIFKNGGHESALSALRWYLAYNLAEQFDDQSIKDIARDIMDGGIAPVPETLEEIIDNEFMYGFTSGEFIEFYLSYSEDNEDPEIGDT